MLEAFKVCSRSYDNHGHGVWVDVCAVWVCEGTHVFVLPQITNDALWIGRQAKAFEPDKRRVQIKKGKRDDARGLKDGEERGERVERMEILWGHKRNRWGLNQNENKQCNVNFNAILREVNEMSTLLRHSQCLISAIEKILNIAQSKTELTLLPGYVFML